MKMDYPLLILRLIVNESNWGKTPATQSLVYSFDSDANNRALQDLGYDGLNDSDEITKYTNGSSLDPAGDNYEYYIDASGGIVNRYKNYNGTQGNSPIEVGILAEVQLLFQTMKM